MTARAILAFALTAATALSMSPAMAQDGGISIELNNAVDQETACRVTFVVENGSQTRAETLTYEVAVFNEEGIVDRMLVLGFGPVDAGRTRVLQFDLADTQCAALSRVLINEVADCSGPANCLDDVNLSSRAGIAFGL